MSQPSKSSRPHLGQRSNPVLTVAKDVGTALRTFLLRDLLATFLLLASIALTITFFSLLDSTRPESPGQRAPLSAIVNLAEAGLITNATLLDHDSVVAVRTRSDLRLYAPYPASNAQTQSLFRTLDEGGAAVTVDQQSFKGERQVIVQFLVPILLLVALFAFFTKLMNDGGAGGIAAFSNIGRKGKKKGKGTAHKVTFDDIAGVPDAVAELREIRDYLADPGKYVALGAGAPKGVLLVGPPGTGKTLLAKAVAGEADATFFSMSGSDFVESLVGVGAARVRDLFAKARKASPAIVFIDELDAAGRKRGAGIGQGNDEREQTLNQLLVEMDGFGGDAGLVVLGATNRPDILDDALLRPGRFDRQVTVDTPDVFGREAILGLYGSKKPLAPDVDLGEIAKLTPGFSGAELANVMNEAALLTVREGREKIDQRTLEEAIDRVIAGPAKPHALTEHERWLIAIHESSHAVVTRAVGQTVVAQKLSVVARGRQLGTSAAMMGDRDAVVQQEPDLQRQLVSIVAGAAGEQMVFGCLSTGVHDDLHAATAIARSMVTSYGMSDALGPVTIGEKQGQVFLGASLQDLGSVGAATLDLIDREVERIVADAKARAEHVLDRNRQALDETARALLEHETLSGHALDAVLATVTPMPVEELRHITAGRPPQEPARDEDPQRGA
ncbi:ATP-dependent zinc metalloprotease FtsH [Paraconexibacter algicola]|uniref:ATP-dependent zinc metalloprotease FtsH n=1 Tax=Paraconexibacter algicola TaxID=2133960 RepID=A0A2T4UN12_9ACTN|nr:ATP-dependent zinc metalloprotease FtsH [Paraconexibacter algicola]PTL60632.1 cell division protein FtsH [Paraconexibacter algicola]